MSTATRRAVVSLAACLALAGGCISVDVGGGEDAVVEPDRFHVVEPAAVEPAGAPPRPAPAATPGPVLAVRAFQSADRIDKRVLLRDAPGRVTPLARDYWADEPTRAVREVARNVFAAHPGYAATVDAFTATKVDLWVDGEVLEYAVAAPPEGPWRAVFRVRLTWTSAKTGELVSVRTEDGAADLPGRTTDGLGPAMARAVRDAVAASLR